MCRIDFSGPLPQYSVPFRVKNNLFRPSRNFLCFVPLWSCSGSNFHMHDSSDLTWLQQAKGKCLLLLSARTKKQCCAMDYLKHKINSHQYIPNPQFSRGIGLHLLYTAVGFLFYFFSPSLWDEVEHTSPPERDF